jgi:hypothetical protein
MDGSILALHFMKVNTFSKNSEICPHWPMETGYIDELYKNSHIPPAFLDGFC